MIRSFPITIIPSEAPPGSRLHGYDRPQYAFNRFGVPPAIVAAVHTGFGMILSDFDCRQIEWEDERHV
jgi:hypothetical protein